jgi:hypothetical protein
MKKVLILLLSLLMIVTAVAQSVYQKKVEELNTRLYQKLGTTKETVMANAVTELGNSPGSLFTIGAATAAPDQCWRIINLVKRYGNVIIVDPDQYCVWYNNELKKIEALPGGPKGPRDLKAESVAVKESKKYLYESIAKPFQNILKRGEFEDITSYKARIDSSITIQYFQYISNVKITNTLPKVYTGSGSYEASKENLKKLALAKYAPERKDGEISIQVVYPPIRYTSLSYNPDTQKFSFSINHWKDGGGLCTGITNTVPDIEKAKSIKDRYYAGEGILFVKKCRMNRSDVDVEELGLLFPDGLNLTIKMGGTSYSRIDGDFKPLRVYFDDLGLNIPQLKGQWYEVSVSPEEAYEKAITTQWGRIWAGLEEKEKEEEWDYEN